MTRYLLAALLVLGAGPLWRPCLTRAGGTEAGPVPGEAAPRAPASAAAPATLMVWNRPIAVFRARITQVSPAERARAAVVLPTLRLALHAALDRLALALGVLVVAHPADRAQ